MIQQIKTTRKSQHTPNTLITFACNHLLWSGTFVLPRIGVLAIFVHLQAATCFHKSLVLVYLRGNFLFRDRLFILPRVFSFLQVSFSLLFKKIYLLIMLLQLSHFPPFTPCHPDHPLPPTFPPYSSCPWVIHISSLASMFPILFLPSPCLFSTYHLCYLFSVPFSPLPLPLPYWQPSMWSPSLWFCSCSSCLPSLLLFLF